MTENKTYLITELSGHRFRLTVPAEWKVTFGPIFQSSGKPARRDYGMGGGGSMEYALRFYETKEKQRAIFTGIASFRDADLPIEYEVVEESGKIEWSASPDAEFKQQDVKRKRSFKAEE